MDVKKRLVGFLEGAESDPCNFIRYCNNLALAYLKKKLQAGDTHLLTLMNSLEDLAWDCIADLFERDHNNNYVQFERYFADETIAELSEHQVQIKLRRLIFSKVNDGLFRNLGVFDMSLSKIIRNLKLAADKTSIAIERYGHHNFLFFDDPDTPKKDKLIIPPEFLEVKITNRLPSTRVDMPEVLAVVTQIFNDQDIYQRRYPLVQLARIIRRSFVRLHDRFPEVHKPHDPIIGRENLRQYLWDSLDNYKAVFCKSYVEKGKIEHEILEKYIRSVERIIEHDFIKESGVGNSYYDHFSMEFPSVSKKRYRDVHRQYLEYMVKVVREDLISNLRKVI